MVELLGNDTEPMRIHEVSHFAQECDVLVVGLGMAGACAALEAQEAGADVLVLERFGGGGGTSANSGGLVYLGGGTPVQEAAGFEDSPEEMYKFLFAVAQPGADEVKIRRFCEGSVEHFHWFERQGVPFKRSFYDEPGLESKTDDCLVYTSGEDCHPWNEIAQPAPRGHKPQVEGKGGPFFMQCMLGAVERAGFAVSLDSCAERLIVGDDGEVLGAVVRSAGELRCVRAKRGVVLSAGGFVMNDAMRDLYAPLLSRCNTHTATPGDDGLGIRIGQSAGGVAMRMELAEVALPYTIPNRLSRGIYVNGQGQRFINEDTYYGHVGIEGLYGQDGCVYLLLDDATFERGLVGMQPSVVGETIEEVEREAGLPSGSLAATLAFYNEHAERGEDPLFHKRAERLVPLVTPPYAIVDCRTENAIWSCFTTGGLRTACDGEVLGVHGAPIPGLYAAGRTAAIFAGCGYPGSGTSLADASFFGRLAGRAAASA